MPINVVSTFSLTSDFPSSTNASLQEFDLTSGNAQPKSYKFKNTALSLSSDNEITVNFVLLSCNNRYVLGYSISALDSHFMINDNSLYSSPIYWLSDQYRLLSGIVGGAIIGTSPQIASLILGTKRKGKKESES